MLSFITQMYRDAGSTKHKMSLVFPGVRLLIIYLVMLMRIQAMMLLVMKFV